MRNLAGDKDCDASIRDELGAVGVEIVEGVFAHSDVVSTVTGRLGPFRFQRAWRYWIVNGPTPLAVAKEIYADPVGRLAVRVNGDCVCPPPETERLRYMGSSGKPLITRRCAGHPRSTNPGPAIAACYAQLDAENEIVDDPAAVAVAAFVDLYHIDTAPGLRLFVDTVRRHGLGGS